MSETEQFAGQVRVYASLYRGDYGGAVLAARAVELAGGTIDSEVAWGLALAHLRLKQFNKARTVLDAAIAREGTSPALWWMLGHVERASRRIDAAERADAAWRMGIQRVQLTGSGGPPGNPRVAAWLACLFAALHDVDAVHEIVEGLIPFLNGYLRYRLAIAEAQLGHAHHAVGLLREAVAVGFRSVQQLKEEVAALGLDGLASDHAYLAVVAEMEQHAGELRDLLAEQGIWALLATRRTAK